MSAAGVTLTELNYTYNVASDSTIYTASVFPAMRGLVGRYNSANTTEEFIKKSTPAEWIETGFHVGYYDALQILQRSSNYGFIRAANNPLYNTASLVTPNLNNTSLSNDSMNFSGGKGLSDIEEFNLDTLSGREVTPITTLTKRTSSTFDADEEFIKTSENDDIVRLWTKAAYEADSNSDPLVEGFLIITGTDNIIQIYTEKKIAGKSEPEQIIYSLPSSVTENEFIIENKYNRPIPEDSFSRCILIYEYSQGDSGISIRVFPYHEIEYLTEENFDSANNELISKQNWEAKEPIFFTTSKTNGLPSGLSDNVNYYLRKNSSTGNYKIFKVKDGEYEQVTFAGAPTGTVRLHATYYDKCKDKDCFTIEVYNAKSGNTPIESWTVSRHPDLLDSSGLSTYVTRVLERSYYIRAIDNTYVPEDVLPMAQIDRLQLKGGSFGGIVTDSHMIKAAQVLRNSTEVPVTLISDAGWSTIGYQKELIDICESRRDCLPIFSVPQDASEGPDALMRTVDYRNGYSSQEGGLGSTRFGAIYTPWIKITSPYNDRDIFIPPAGIVVGLICRNAANTQMWAVPAGYKRGIVSAKSLSHNWSYTLQGTGDIATLVDNQINPIIRDREGNLVVWGNETLVTARNDMSALSNSLVMIIIQPSIIHLLRRYVTFENITDDVLDDIQTIIRNYLDNIKGNLGISDFIVVCDSSNNTEATISQNTIVVDVAHKPMNYIKHIQYRHTITRNLDSTTIVSSAMSS